MVFDEHDTPERPPMPDARELTDRRPSFEQRSRRLVRAKFPTETEFAEVYLKIARLLLAYGRTDVARRRLKRVVDKYANTPAAAESRNLLTAMSRTGDGAGRS
jgi:TolA-binding protein